MKRSPAWPVTLIHSSRRTATFGLLIGATALFGCDADSGNKSSSSASPSAKSASTGVQVRDVKSADVKTATDACAGYVKALEDCIAKQDGAAKQPWQKTLDAHKRAFKEAGPAAKAQMETSCTTGRFTIQQGCK